MGARGRGKGVVLPGDGDDRVKGGEHGTVNGDHGISHREYEAGWRKRGMVVNTGSGMENT